MKSKKSIYDKLINPTPNEMGKWLKAEAEILSRNKPENSTDSDEKLSIDLTDDLKNNLNEIKETLNLTDDYEAIKLGISIATIIVKEKAKKGKVLIESSNGIKHQLLLGDG